MKNKITTLITLLASGSLACAATTGPQAQPEIGAAEQQQPGQAYGHQDRSQIGQDRAELENPALLISEIRTARYEEREQVAEKVEKHLKKAEKGEKGRTGIADADRGQPDALGQADQPGQPGQASPEMTEQQEQLAEQVRENLEALKESDENEFFQARNELAESFREYVTTVAGEGAGLGAGTGTAGTEVDLGR